MTGLSPKPSSARDSSGAPRSMRVAVIVLLTLMVVAALGAFSEAEADSAGSEPWLVEPAPDVAATPVADRPDTRGIGGEGATTALCVVMLSADVALVRPPGASGDTSVLVRASRG